MQTAIDIHSHMLCEEWLALFKAHSGPRFSIRQVMGGREVIHAEGVPFMTPTPGMFDYKARSASWRSPISAARCPSSPRAWTAAGR